MEGLGARDAHRTDDVRSVATGDLGRHDVERGVVVDDLEHELDVVVRLVERGHDRLLGRDLGRVIARSQTAEPIDLDDLPGRLAGGGIARARILGLAGLTATGGEDQGQDREDRAEA